MKRLLSGFMTLLIILSLCAGCGKPAPTTSVIPTVTTTATVPTGTVSPQIDYTNTTVILYTVNVRGDLAVYSQIATVRAHYEQLGATVYLVDAGNYLQGSVYTGTDMGLTAYYLMDAVGYDVAGMGVYDFAHGEATVGHADHGDLTYHYTQAELYRGTEAMTYQKNASWFAVPSYATRAAKTAATFQVVCSNLQIGENATGYYDFESSAVLGTQLQVGFVSYLQADAAQKLYDGFLGGYEICEVVAPECDILVSFGAGEGDIVIDIPADGALEVGAYVIDHTTKDICFETVELDKSNATVDAWIHALPVNPVVGVADMDLNGSRRENCNGQTALGTLVADALKWYAQTWMEGIEYPLIGLFNGGNCTGFLYNGQITQQDLRNAIHGSKDGVGVVYLTGAQILEMLEAATQREDCPGWAQVSGLQYHVDTQKAYDFGAAYGLYYRANSINRVSIATEGFDLEATYAVVADMLLLKGEDTYYILKDCEIVVKDGSGGDICQILELYIQEVLNGHIGG